MRYPSLSRKNCRMQAPFRFTRHFHVAASGAGSQGWMKSNFNLRLSRTMKRIRSWGSKRK
jgi:hypothetical protein